MAKYLDPKNDLVFKRVFGEHPEILRSLLNALLPLSESEKIVALEYLSPEQVPVIPLHKFSIVDVRCRDKGGRQFIVEMQMQWTNAFMERVLFNANCTYHRKYLSPRTTKERAPAVFGLSVINDIFAPANPNFYHHYKMVNIKDAGQVIKGLHLVFIELPKFTKTEDGLDADRVGWLRYLQETGNPDSKPEELTANGPEMQHALQLAETATYSEGEMEAYYKYWDFVSTEKTLMAGKLREGIEIGVVKGRKEGLEEGIQNGRQQLLRETLEKMIASGMSPEAARTILGIEKAG